MARFVLHRCAQRKLKRPRFGAFSYVKLARSFGWKMRGFFGMGYRPIFCAPNLESIRLDRREQELEALLMPTVESLGCEIWGIEFLRQGKYSKLRLYIDRPGEEMVTVDDCADVSRHVGDILDVEDFSNNAYTLEVSSPGMDRILFKSAQYQASVGEQVDIRLNFPFEGRKKFIGILAGVEDNSAVLQIDDEEFVLPIENIQKARVVPTFDK